MGSEITGDHFKTETTQSKTREQQKESTERKGTQKERRRPRITEEVLRQPLDSLTQ